MLQNPNLFKIINESNIKVNSAHHQAVKDVGKNLIVKTFIYFKRFFFKFLYTNNVNAYTKFFNHL